MQNENHLCRVFIGILVLALASLACNMFGSSALLEDDFSDGDKWGTDADDDHSVKYSDGALHMSVNKDLYFVWSTYT